MTLLRAGAASHYLYQYALPGSGIGGGDSHMGILYRACELCLLAIFCSGEIDVSVTLLRAGAASYYLYQYAPPGSEIGGGYSHICV